MNTQNNVDNIISFMHIGHKVVDFLNVCFTFTFLLCSFLFFFFGGGWVRLRYNNGRIDLPFQTLTSTHVQRNAQSQMVMANVIKWQSH